MGQWFSVDAAEFYRRVFGFPTLLESERLIPLAFATPRCCRARGQVTGGSSTE